MKNDDDANFPIDVRSPFVNFLQNIILYGIKCLALLMTLVILWSMLDVLVLIYQKSRELGFLLIDIDELLKIFGAFLAVLIAIEIFLNIILYLRKDMGHLRLVIATALMAIARKVIILDYDKISEWQMVGIGSIIVALGLAYWFICRGNHLLSLPLSFQPSNEDLHLK